MLPMPKILGVIASGRGTDFQAILDHQRMGIFNDIELGVLISNKADAYALERARRARLPTRILEPQPVQPEATDMERSKARVEFDRRIIQALKDHHVDLVVLAGYDRILSPMFVETFRWQILNIHPGDPEHYGGLKMVGRRVHEAVINAGEKMTYPTVHFVDHEVDRGPVILQSPVPVYLDDTPELLERRVLMEEHLLYPKAIQLMVDGRVSIRSEKGRYVAEIDKASWDKHWDSRQLPYRQYQTSEDYRRSMFGLE